MESRLCGGAGAGRSRWWYSSVSLSRTKQKPALKGEIMGTLTEVSFFFPFSLPPSQSSMNTCSVTDTSIGTEGQNPQLVSNWWKQTTQIHQELSEGVERPVDAVSVQIWSD